MKVFTYDLQSTTKTLDKLLVLFLPTSRCDIGLIAWTLSYSNSGSLYITHEKGGIQTDSVSRPFKLCRWLATHSLVIRLMEMIIKMLKDLNLKQ